MERQLCCLAYGVCRRGAPRCPGAHPRIRETDEPATATRDLSFAPFTTADFPFPNLRSGTGLLDVEVIDNETAGAVVLESAGDTLMIVDDLETAGDETTGDRDGRI